MSHGQIGLVWTCSRQSKPRVLQATNVPKSGLWGPRKEWDTALGLRETKSRLRGGDSDLWRKGLGSGDWMIFSVLPQICCTSWIKSLWSLKPQVLPLSCKGRTWWSLRAILVDQVLSCTAQIIDDPLSVSKKRIFRDGLIFWEQLEQN